MNMLLLTEAINSTAMSHPEGHECDVCRAANGDKEAFKRVAIDLTLGALKDRGAHRG